MKKKKKKGGLFIYGGSASWWRSRCKNPFKSEGSFKFLIPSGRNTHANNLAFVCLVKVFS